MHGVGAVGPTVRDHPRLGDADSWDPRGPCSERRRPQGLAFAALNIVRNPFGELTLEERARLVVAPVDGEARWLRGALARTGGGPRFGHGRRLTLQLLGPSGCGKTSYLLALRDALPTATFVAGCEPVSVRHLAWLRRPVLLVDEANALPAWYRRLLLRYARALAVTTTVDLRPELERARRITKTVRPGESMVARDLAAIFNRRIEAVRRAPGPIPFVPRNTIRELMKRYGCDIRAMVGCLYGAVQEMEGVDRVEV